MLFFPIICPSHCGHPTQSSDKGIASIGFLVFLFVCLFSLFPEYIDFKFMSGFTYFSKKKVPGFALKSDIPVVLLSALIEKLSSLLRKHDLCSFWNNCAF